MGKKEIRKRFRDAVFVRDGYRCVMCGFESSPERVAEDLDCHHISERGEMLMGGYVAENGISLCKDGPESCHIKAELWLNGSGQPEGFSADELYLRIGSSLEEAEKASCKLQD